MNKIKRQQTVLPVVRVMIKWLACLMPALCICFCTQVHGQHFSVYNYTTRDGLPNPVVYGMTQDHDGFIWFGTEMGLSRFDGQNFKNYTMADGLPSNEVLDAYVDSKNRVWIVCFTNAICYIKDGVVCNQENDPVLARIKFTSNLFDIAENNRGDILVRSRSESFVLSADNRLQRATGHHLQQTFAAVSGIGGLGLYTLAINPLIRARIRDSSTLNTLPARKFDRSDSNTYDCYVLHGSPRTADFFRSNDPAGGFNTQKLPPGTKYVQQISQSLFSFIRNGKGVSLYDASTPGSYRDYLNRYIVNYVMQDSENNLWFSTKGQGVFKMSGNRFKSYSFDNLGVRDIRVSGSKVFIGTDNNAYWSIPVPDHNSFLEDGGVAPVQVHATLTGILSGHDRYYITCAGSDFLGINKHFAPAPGSVKSIHVYGDTVLMSSSSNCVTALILAKRVIAVIYNGRTTCALRSGKDYYVGTLNGLYRVHEGVSHRLSDREPRLRGPINQISPGRDGLLWIATAENGVIGLQHNRVVSVINQKSGLLSNNIHCISLAHSTFWIGTDKGLNRVVMQGLKPSAISRITEADGLNANVINVIYPTTTAVYVGTSLGMTVFVERPLSQPSMCNFKLTEITVSGKKRPPSSPLVLDPYDNNIRFAYSGISFSSAGDMTYRYRLSGLNDQWQVTQEPALSYPSLPSGKYELQIEAINRFGQRSKQFHFAFKVSPTIWEQWWFRIGTFVLIILLMTILIRWRIKRQHANEHAKLTTSHKLMELEQMALRAQMNPHFIFNCLNSMQYFILNQDARKANYYLSRFAALVRQTLENSSRAYISLKEELDYIKNYIELERLQLSEQFSYSITTDMLIDHRKVDIPNMILQPYIENAIKHGINRNASDAHIHIEFTMNAEERSLQCVIEDNGAGIASKKKKAIPNSHKSLGMPLTERRIKTINQLSNNAKDIRVTVEDISNIPDKTGTGTRVTVIFPL